MPKPTTRKTKKDWGEVVELAKNGNYNYDNIDEQRNAAAERYNVNRFAELYDKSITEGNRLSDNAQNGNSATLKELQDYKRTINALDAFYNDDLFKKYYDESTRQGLKSSVSEVKAGNDALQEWYSDYTNTADYQNASYEKQHAYLDEQTKEAKKNKWERIFGAVLTAEANAANTKAYNALPTKSNRMALESTQEQASEQIGKAMEATEEANYRNNLEIQHYHANITDKYLDIIDNDEELEAALKAHYEAEEKIDNASNGIATAGTMDLVQINAKKDKEKARSDIKALGYSSDETDNLIDAYTWRENDKKAKDQAEAVEEFSKEHPVLATGAHAAANVAQIAAVPEILANGIENQISGDYKPLDTNTAAFTATRFRETVSNTVSQSILDSVSDETWGQVLSFAYQTGLSIVDCASLAWLPEPMSLAIMGTTAGVAATKDAADRGVSADQAMWTGIFAGAAEIFFERFSLSELKAFATTNERGFKNAIKNILKQTFTEGSEELATDLTNAFFDDLINGDHSNWQMQYQQFLEEADGDKNAAMQQLAIFIGKQLGESFAGGALSGAVMGTGGHAVNRVMNYANGNQILHNGTEFNSLKDYAAQSENAEVQKVLSKVNTAFSRQTVSPALAGDLFAAVALEMDNSFDGAKSIDELNQRYEAAVKGANAGSMVLEYAKNAYQAKADELIKKQNKADRRAAKEEARTERRAARQQNKGNTASVGTTRGNRATANTAAQTDSTAQGTTQSTTGTSRNVVAQLVDQSVSGEHAVKLNVTDANGAAGTVTVAGYSGNHLVLKTADGKLVSSENVKTGDAFLDKVLKAANDGANERRNFGANGAATFIKLAMEHGDSPDFQDYSRQAANAYNLGVREQRTFDQLQQAISNDTSDFTLQLSLKPVLDSYIKVLGEDGTRALYEAGALDRKGSYGTVTLGSDFSSQAQKGDTAAKNEQKTETKEKSDTKQKEGQKGAQKANNSKVNSETKAKFDNVMKAAPKAGVTDVSTQATPMQQSEMSLLNEIAKKNGVQVIVVNNTAEVGYDDANGLHSQGRIVLSLNNEAGLMSVYFGHEMVHRFNGTAKQQYTKLHDFVIEYLKNSPNYDYDEELAKIVDRWDFKGTETEKIAAAEEEMVANSAFTVLSEEANFKRLVQEDRQAGQKVVDFFRNFVAQIREALRRLTGNAEYRALQNDLEAKEKILRLWEDCLNASKGKEAADNGETKFSIDPNFAKQYDNWDKKKSGFAFRIGTTSKALQEIGVNDKSIWWDASKILKIKRKHSAMTDEVIKQVPNVLENPMLVMESKTAASRITMFGELYDANGDPVLAVLELSPNDKGGNSLDILKVASAYGKDKNPQSLINTSVLLYINADKNKVRNWLTVNRLQLPLPSSKYGLVKKLSSTSNNSISNSSRNVNTQTTKHSAKEGLAAVDSEGNELSTQQSEYFKDSKVRDENGNLLVVYHGTPNNFTVFEHKGYSNLGFYFTADKKYANTYSKGNNGTAHKGNLMQGYLNITKPFDINDPETRKVFIHDYVKGGYAQGINPYISEAEIEKAIVNGVDWTEGDNLIDFIEENELEYDGLILNEGADTVVNSSGTEVLYRGISYVALKSNQFKNIDNTSPTINDDVRYSAKEGITVNMNEKERADVLQHTSIVPTVDTSNDADIDVDDYNDIKSRIEKPLRDKLDSLGVFKKYRAAAIEVDFEFTHKGYNKSLHSQNQYGGNNADFARVIANIEPLLENAVLIEMHTDKGIGTKKEKNYIDQYFVLVSVLKNGDNIIPVQFEIEQYYNNENRLYLAVAMTQIKEAGVAETATTENGVEQNLLPASEYSIADIFKKINPVDKNFLKYVPDEFLNQEQINAKNEALAEEQRKYNGMQYSRKGDVTDVNSVLSENEELREAAEELQKALEIAVRNNDKLKQEFKITGKRNLSENDTTKVATFLRQQYGSSMDKGKLTEKLMQLYDYMVNAGDSISMDYVANTATDIARELMSETNYWDDSRRQEFKDTINMIRNTRLYASEDVKGIDDYNDFRKRSFGKIRLVNDANAMGVEELYDMLAQQGTSVVSGEAVGVEDQLNEILDFMESTKPVVRNAAEERVAGEGLTIDEYANIIGGDIIYKFFDVPEKLTFAEKQQKKFNQALQNYQNKMADMKQTYEDMLEDQKKHYVDMNKRRTERRKISETKSRIRRLKGKLDTDLLHPTDNRYVPQYLVSEVIKACEVLTEADRMRQDGKARSENVQLHLDKLKTQYDMLAKDADSDYSGEYDSDFSYQIADLAGRLNGKQINELSLKEITEVYHTLKTIYDTLRDATKQIGTEEKISNHQRAVQLIEEVNATAGQSNRVFGFFEGEGLNPIRYVRKYSEFKKDAVLVQLMDALEQGSFKADKFIADASKPFIKLQDVAKQYREFSQTQRDFGVVDMDGKPVMMTENQAVQLYMTALRKEGLYHLNHGGADLANLKQQLKGNNGKAADQATRIAAGQGEQILAIRGKLSSYAMEWVNAAQYLFDTQSKKAINDTSLVLKHRKIATTKNYIKLEVVGTQVAKDLDVLKHDSTLEGAGNLKSTVQNAGQAVVIRGIAEIANDQINFTARYSGLAIPIRNFNKVYNGKTSAYYDADMEQTTVKEAIQNKWGTGATGLLESVITDLQSPSARRPTTFKNDKISSVLEKANSNFVVATLANNIQVAIKQAASYPTAGSVLSTASLFKGLKGFTGGEKSGLWDEIDEHTGLHFKRRMGYSIPEIGQLKEQHSWLNKLPKQINPMNWIQAIDVGTTSALWVASKAEIERTQPELERGSAAYWDEVVKTYEKVITETQPNYDALHRPEVQKSGNALKRNLFMFRTQPMQNSGILYDAAFELRQMEKNLKADDTEANRLALTEAKRKFGKAVASQTVSAIVFTGMTLLGQALKHNMFGYRDDDDEVTAESVLMGVLKNLGEYAFGLLLPIGGSELASVIERLSGESTYDTLSVPVVQTVNDYISSLYKLNQRLDDVHDALENDESVEANNIILALVDVVTKTGDLVGLPVSNAYALVKGIYNNIMDFAHGEPFSFRNGITKNTATYYQELYDYKTEGDTKNYDRLYNKLLEDGKTEDAISNGLRDMLIQNDIRIAEAGIAYNDGDMDAYIDAVNAIMKEGYTEKQATTAIKTYASSIDKAREYLDAEDIRHYNAEVDLLTMSGMERTKVENAINNVEPEEESEAKTAQIYKYNEMITALDSGETDAYRQMYDSIIAIEQQNGKSKEDAEKNIKGKLKTYYKDDYVKNTEDRAEIERKLNATGLFDDGDYTSWAAEAYNTESMVEAFEGGESSTKKYVSERISAKVANGMEEKSAAYGIRTSIANQYKQEFIDGDDSTRMRIITYMTNTGLYGSRSDVVDYIDKNWLK